MGVRAWDKRRERDVCFRSVLGVVDKSAEEEEGVLFASLMIDDIQSAVSRRADGRTADGLTRRSGSATD